MSCRQLAYFVIVMLLSTKFCISQDIIYLENNQVNGTVIEIVADKVKFRRPENPGPIYSIARNKVKLIFNHSGEVLIMKRLDSLGTKQSEKLVTNFIDPTIFKEDLQDKIFTLDFKQLYCSILTENETSFSVSINDVTLEINKTSIAVIFYKNGNHKLIAGVNEVAEVLYSLQISNSNIAGNRETDISNKKLIPQQSNINSTGNVKQVGNNFKASKRTEESVISSDNEQEKTLLAQRKKAALDSLNLVNFVNKKYKLALDNGDNFNRNGDFEKARNAYLEADSLKPNEKGLQVKLDLINKKILEIEKKNNEDHQFDSLIAIANNLLSQYDWYAAKSNYKKALDLKPSDYYSQRQLNYLEEEIAKKENEERIEEERKRKKENEKKYDLAIQRGDLAIIDASTQTDTTLQIKYYQVALDAFNEALTIHPEKEYPKLKVNTLSFTLDKLRRNKNR